MGNEISTNIDYSKGLDGDFKQMPMPGQEELDAMFEKALLFVLTKNI